MARYDRMAIDFGTSNTIVAFWNEESRDVDLHHVPDVTRPFLFKENGRELEIPYIPSLIYYEKQNKSFVGDQVIARMVEKSKGAFRWIKAYIQSRRTIKYTLDHGGTVDYFQAGRDFLERVCLFAAESGHVDLASCEVAFTVPVEHFEHYTQWLADTCRDIGIRRYRFIDESSACIFGYDTHLQANDKYLIFDFGGGTLDVSVVRVEEQVSKGLGCRVLGKAGCRIGGRTIDGLLYAELLRRARVHAVDARAASALFMQGVEEIKERLTEYPSWEFDFKHPENELRLQGIYHRTELEDLLEAKGILDQVNQTLERVLVDARERGVDKADIKEALLVGGSSHIPCIRREVRRYFGSRTRFYRPYDAVARGACRYLSSDVEALYDHIQHDYAIKGYNPKKGEHVFIPLVDRGTNYPTEPDFKKMTLKATREGQRFFGINIYEVAQKGSSGGGLGEIVFDLSGGAVFDNGARDLAAGTEFWLNEDRPTFIEAEPVAERGTKRFAISFRIDSLKHLQVTVRDLLTQKLLYNDYPVVKLK